MKRFLTAFACILMIASSSIAAANAPSAGQMPPGARLNHAFGRLPMRFEANLGQTDPRVGCMARGEGYALFLPPTEAAIAVRAPGEEGSVGALRMRLRGSSPEPAVAGVDRLPGASNYL